MIQADIRVNGTVIGVLTCVNKGYRDDERETTYRVVLVQVSETKVIECWVTHDPSDGFAVLMEKAFGATTGEAEG